VCKSSIAKKKREKARETRIRSKELEVGIWDLL
jgi:hypothetical protein